MLAILDLPDSEISYQPQFLTADLADAYFQRIVQQADWRQESIYLFGKPYLQPRLSAWYGDEGCTYTYSGLAMQPLPWLPALLELRTRLQNVHHFNSVLANYYRNGQDSVGWHSDNEAGLGTTPVIASISLGAERRFCLQHKKSKQHYQLILTHGSLLLMAGFTQRYWRHQLPKTKQPIGTRLNLSFRTITHL